MKILKDKKNKEKKLIWLKFRYYLDFIILVCCTIIAFNIHPSNITNNKNTLSDKPIMTYIFHDYEWNEYIMNDKTHGAPSSRDYLFNEEIPNDLKWDEKEYVDSVSIGDLMNNENSNDIKQTWTVNDNNSVWVKDNQVSMDDIMTDLWIVSTESGNSDLNMNEISDINIIEDSDSITINIWYTEKTPTESDYYTTEEKNWSGKDSSLIIKKFDNNKDENNETWNKSEEWNSIKTSNSEDNNLPIAKTFTFINEGRILPTLASINDLYSNNSSKSIMYTNNYWDNIVTNETFNESWITIIDDYASCMTPWWYKISHWDSVLAYKQMESTPDICHIERRFCRKWKLSWTYTQQWCSINKNYTYEQRWDIKTSNNPQEEFKWDIKQNSDWSVTVKDNEIWWSFVFDRPNNTYSDFSNSDNIRTEEPEIEQTTRPHWDCTSPRWEKVKHWDFIQAFKHANWFSDSPCEAQIRLCTMWELMWTYTEPTCKTRDTSFIDRINGSPTRDTYSKEKIERVKKQIKNEKIYYEDSRKDAARSTNSEALDRILYILDQD